MQASRCRTGCTAVPVVVPPPYRTQGLEDQLLGEVVRKERPDLEEAKDRLVLSISADKKQLAELEDKILKLLKVLPLPLLMLLGWEGATGCGEVFFCCLGGGELFCVRGLPADPQPPPCPGLARNPT